MATHWTLRTKSMEQSPCWEDDSRNSWANREFKRILWTPKALLHVHRRMPLVPILRQKNPVRSLQSYFCMIHFYVVLLSTPVIQAVSFLQVPSPKYTHISSPQCMSHSKPMKLIFKKFWAVSARSKAGVCGLSPAGIAGRNPAGGMAVWLLWMLCVFKYKSLRRADPWSREVLPSVCLCVRSDATITL